MTEYSEKNLNDLIDQYKDGSISESDRFALEKKALDDPFLFDALEGYALYDDKKESTKTKGAKLFTLPRIAAAASLVFLFSMVFVMKNNNNTTAKENNKIAMVVPEKDNSTASDITTADQSSQGGTIETKNTSSPSPIVNTTAKRTTKRKESAAIATKTTPSQKKTTSKENLETTNVKVGDIKNTSQSTAEIEDKETQKPVTKSYTNEESEIVESAPTAPKDAATEVYEIADTNDEQPSMLDSDDVADISVSPELDAFSKAKKEETPSIIYIVEPMIGKSDFDEYVKQRIDQRSDLKQTPPQEIIIEFSIDKNGEISDFIHIMNEDGCSPCGSFALNILQNSGVWKTVPAGNEGRARYTFKF